MATFTYKAKQGPDRTEEGVIDAFSRAEAADVLHARGLVPINIEEKQGGVAEKQKRWTRRITRRDIVVFTYQLASLIRSGVPILRALSTIRAQTEHPRFKRLVGEIEGSIRDGEMLSDALMGVKDGRDLLSFSSALIGTGVVVFLVGMRRDR